MSDSEVMTRALIMDYLPFPGETQFLGFIAANYQTVVSTIVTSQSVQPTFAKTGNNVGNTQVFHEIQNTGRNRERLLNKTVAGFATHMAAKISFHTLRLLLRRQFGIDVQTFQSTTTY